MKCGYSREKAVEAVTDVQEEVRNEDFEIIAAQRKESSVIAV